MAYTYLVGQPCQRMVGVPPDMRECGEPAMFLYRGLIPEGMKPKELARRGHPCNMILCPDDAKALAHDFAWLIRDGKTRIERLDMVVHRFNCTNCLSNTKVIWDMDAPQGFPGPLKYCPRCGHETLAMVDAEADYWDLMAQAFQGMPVQLLKMLYEEWDRGRYQRFRDYVEAEIQAYDQTGDLIANAS